MSEKEKLILQKCKKMLPLLSDRERENFLFYVEGMTVVSERRESASA